MKPEDYKWFKTKNGMVSVAIVNLIVENNKEGKNKIFEHYSGEGFTGQGNIESVPQNGYEAWKIGARNGLVYALSLIDSKWIIHINKIEGLTTDTNSTIVGYTVLRAFLEQINFQLTNEEIARLEDFVLKSWVNPPKILIPDFFNLTFSDFD